jgi:hypothetical protein
MRTSRTQFLRPILNGMSRLASASVRMSFKDATETLGSGAG